MAPHKEAYFNLLRRLEAFRSDVEQPNLRGEIKVMFVSWIPLTNHLFCTERVVRLLFPLYSWFVIHRGESSSRGGLQPPCTRVTRMEIPPGLRRGRLTLSSQRQGNPSALMPRQSSFVVCNSRLINNGGYSTRRVPGRPSSTRGSPAGALASQIDQFRQVLQKLDIVVPYTAF